jgi:hypothetical protein
MAVIQCVAGPRRCHMTCVMERPRKLATSSKARSRRRKQSMIFFSGSPPGTWKSRVNEVVPVYSHTGNMLPKNRAATEETTDTCQSFQRQLLLLPLIPGHARLQSSYHRHGWTREAIGDAIEEHLLYYLSGFKLLSPWHDFFLLRLTTHLMQNTNSNMQNYLYFNFIY